MELVVVLGLMSALLGIGLLRMREFSNPASTGAVELVTFFKKARSKALANTLAYTVKPQNSKTIITTYGTSCTATQTSDSTFILHMPGTASVGSLTWSVCYSTRGLASSSGSISVSDGDNAKTVSYALGGAVKVL
jgi:hypothetical protein